MKREVEREARREHTPRPERERADAFALSSRCRLRTCVARVCGEGFIGVVRRSVTILGGAGGAGRHRRARKGNTNNPMRGGARKKGGQHHFAPAPLIRA
jgi:hypothetical protein